MICPRCGTEIPSTGQISLEPVECTSCGKVISAATKAWDTPLGWVQGYFHDLWQIIAHPKDFFRHMPARGGMLRPLSFALVTHWLGTAIAFIWKTSFGSASTWVVENLSRWSRDSEIDSSGKSFPLSQLREQIHEWFMGAGPVIVDPFLSLASIFFMSFLIYLGARILIFKKPVSGSFHEPPEVHYETVVRIVCFGMSPAILAALPFVGNMVATLAVTIVTVVGFKEVYQTGTVRAFIVYLFPKIIFLGTITLGLLSLVMLFLRFFASFF